MKACIYTRISTTGQQEGTSLGAQYAACLAKAQAIGAEVVLHVEEVESGGLYLARPGIQQALSAIERGDADALIVAKLDRTGRDVEGLRDIRRRLHKAGAQLIFADGLQFERSAVGNLMFTQLAGFAEYEKEIIRERLTKGTRRKVEQGIPMARALAPYGYRIIRKADVTRGATEPAGTYVVRPEQAEIVKRIFAEYAAGKSLRQIGAGLMDDGILPGDNHAARAKANHIGGRWSVATLSYILRNPVYIGRPVWGRTQHHVDEARTQQGMGAGYLTQRPEAEWLHLSAPAIIDAATWQATQERLANPRPGRSGAYLLTGLVRCPLCGGRVVGCTGSRNQHGRRYVWRYYRCTHALTPEIARHPTAPRCLHKRVRQADLEADVIAAVEAVSHAGVLVPALREWAAAQRKQASGTHTRQQGLKRALSALERQEQASARAMTETIAAGGSGSSFAGLLADLSKRKAALVAQLAEPAEPTPAPREAARTVAEAAGLVARALRHEGTPAAERNLWLRRVVVRVVPEPAGTVVTLRGAVAGQEIQVTMAADGPILTVRNVQ